MPIREKNGREHLAKTQNELIACSLRFWKYCIWVKMAELW
jgi:hypothetical protein